jgi:hypothetical protein
MKAFKTTYIGGGKVWHAKDMWCACGQRAHHFVGSEPECEGCHYRNSLYKQSCDHDIHPGGAAVTFKRMGGLNEKKFPSLRYSKNICKQ